MFEVAVDEDKGWIRSKSLATWTLEAADRYEDELDRLSSAIRRKFDRVKMLHDARDQGVQPQAVSQRFEKLPGWIRGERDRLAIVVNTSLHKMQARRLFNDPRVQAFMSLDAAEMWLSAEASQRI